MSTCVLLISTRWIMKPHAQCRCQPTPSQRFLLVWRLKAAIWTYSMTHLVVLGSKKIRLQWPKRPSISFKGDSCILPTSRTWVWTVTRQTLPHLPIEKIRILLWRMKTNHCQLFKNSKINASNKIRRNKELLYSTTSMDRKRVWQSITTPKKPYFQTKTRINSPICSCNKK